MLAALIAPAAAGVIVEPPALPTVSVSVSATSTLHDKTGSYEAWHVLAGDPTKYWCSAGGYDDLALHFAAAAHVDSLTLRAGVWRSPEMFADYNRLTGLHVTADDGFAKEIALREAREDVVIHVGRDVRELHLSDFAVQEAKIKHTCISGIDLHFSPAAAVVVVADAANAPALEPAFHAAWRAFTACKGLAPLAVNGKRLDGKALAKACKDGVFVPYVTSGDAPRVKAEAPGKATVIAGSFEWHFVLDGKAWRLAGLVDTSR